MKNLLSIAMILMTTVIFAQNRNAKASFEVDGVCTMCKERIEKASIKTKGVKSANWDVNTHQLDLIYNEKKTNLNAIKGSVLEAGHDLANTQATDEAYASIHDCCKYRDEEVKDDHKDDKTK
ncbi:heavy-metal-associated domain-containing protein [Mesonia sp.]|uniref:heavy-metal-associated domain-containing protein n=1 Tax=Mesonia sp. TaxID=1960830 RepID=UPI003F9DA08B